MKRVTFEIAKTLNNAKYPQGETDKCFDSKGILHYTSSTDSWLKPDIYIDVPTYMDVWLWLCRNKNIFIQPIKHVNGFVSVIFMNDGKSQTLKDVFDDAEDAIVASIKFLVENDLIENYLIENDLIKVT